VADSVSQSASSDRVHPDVFVLTVTASEVPPAPGRPSESVDTDKVGDPAACVTVTVTSDAPSAETVTVAERSLNVRFGSAVAVNVPPSDPLVVDSVSQSASSDKVHPDVFVETATASEVPPTPGRPSEPVDTARLGDPAACATVTVTSEAPSAFTVTVAERALSVGFGSAVTVNVSPSTPEPADSESQSASSDSDQPDVFVETVTASDTPPAATRLNERGSTDSVGDPAACVTATVTSDAPSAFTVTVAERPVKLGFGSAVTVNVSPSVPELADSESHSASSARVQPDVFVLTVTAADVPPTPGKPSESVFTARVGDPAA
jgi:hypothetical protein